MRKVNVLFSCFFALAALSAYSCGWVKNAEKNGDGNKASDSVYVFDKPVITDTVNANPQIVAPVKEAKYYIVQIGAFTTKEKAETFLEEARNILKYKTEISYSNNINLYVVQLTPTYGKKEDAEKVRNYLWKFDKFKDAWILTVTR